MKLENHNAIITGASQGLGAAIAEQFVREGASVLLCSRKEPDVALVRDRLAALAGPDQQVVAMACDVASVSAVDEMVAYARKKFVRIDSLINNAGVYGPMGALDDVNWQEWVDTIAINLHGTVYPCRAVLPMMKTEGKGKIINISGGGATNPLPGISAYAASKAAVVRFTETLALEAIPFGVSVNAVAPGALATRMMDQLVEAGPEKVGQAFYDRMVKIRAAGGTSLDVGARCCVWLASDASNGVNGKLVAAQWDPYEDFPNHLDELSEGDIYTLRRIVPKDRGKTWGND